MKKKIFITAILSMIFSCLFAQVQTSTPEKTIRSFYLAYCNSSGEMQLKPSAMKKYITTRLYNEIEKAYKDNPASDWDRYTWSSGDGDLKSIKEVGITNISKGKTTFKGDVALKLEDGSLNLKVKLIKEKSGWKIDGITGL